MSWLLSIALYSPSTPSALSNLFWTSYILIFLYRSNVGARPTCPLLAYHEQLCCRRSDTLQDVVHIWGGADKSLAWPGKKQATATKLGIYSTYSPRSSIHFLAHCSNFASHSKENSEGCPSNQVSAAAMTSALDEKWRPFNCFFSPGNRW